MIHGENGFFIFLHFAFVRKKRANCCQDAYLIVLAERCLWRTLEGRVGRLYPGYTLLASGPWLLCPTFPGLQ